MGWGIRCAFCFPAETETTFAWPRNYWSHLHCVGSRFLQTKDTIVTSLSAAKSNREMLNAMIYWLNTGIPWRDLPERFGPWQSVYSRFRAWTKAGVWENVLTNLIQQDIVDETTLMLDSTTIKVHQHARGAKKGAVTRPPDAAGEA